MLQDVFRLKGVAKVEKHSDKKQKKEREEKIKDTYLKVRWVEFWSWIFTVKVKDIDWVSQGRKLLLTPPDMARFKAYLEKDVAVSQNLSNSTFMTVTSTSNQFLFAKCSELGIWRDWTFQGFLSEGLEALSLVLCDCPGISNFSEKWKHKPYSKNFYFIKVKLKTFLNKIESLRI